MNLKTDYFYVMYRKSKGAELPKNMGLLSEFKLIKNPPFRWCADPFPIIINGKQYIFAEIMSRVTGKAAIGYVCLDSKKPKWKKCFSPKFHISFPNIFVDGEEIVAMPETYQDHCLAKYAVSREGFTWSKKEVVFSSPYCVDSCFIKNEKTVLFTYENSVHCSKNPNHLVVRNYKEPSEIFFSLIDKEGLLRPAGNCFEMDGKLILPTQDCSSIYGRGVIFNEVDLQKKAITRLGASIYPSDIKANSHFEKAAGCHTYNFCDSLEAIDVLLPTFSIRGVLHKIKKKFSR